MTTPIDEIIEEVAAVFRDPQKRRGFLKAIGCPDFEPPREFLGTAGRPDAAEPPDGARARTDENLRRVFG